MNNKKQSLEILRQTKEVNNNMIAEASEKQAFSEAFDDAIEALEKQIPKKCEYGNGFYPCPNCDKATVEDNNWCSGCGQAIIH